MSLGKRPRPTEEPGGPSSSLPEEADEEEAPQRRPPLLLSSSDGETIPISWEAAKLCGTLQIFTDDSSFVHPRDASFGSEANVFPVQNATAAQLCEMVDLLDG